MHRLLLLLVSSLALFLSAATHVVAHGPADSKTSEARLIQFPNTKSYQTLVLDLHTHSVFSDGHVWPTIRVSEALKDGLDGLAITEHLEFQPHLSDIPHPDRNRAYEEALRAAEGHPLHVIPGVEITRTGPPGHINAVFVKDANPLVRMRGEGEELPQAEFATKEEAVRFTQLRGPLFHGAHSVERDGETVWRPYPEPATYQAIMNFGLAVTFDTREVLKLANEQGAFVFWNHPSFESVDAELNDFHRSATEDGLLHGIEIANGDRYYPNAHRLALKHNLALIGVSDVHELIEWDYRPQDAHNPGHRPVTLVLAEDDSIAAMRDALFARRSIVWWKDKLIGRPKHLNELLEATLSIESIERSQWGMVAKIRNNSDAPLQLRQKSNIALTNQTGTILIKPNDVTELTMNLDHGSSSVVFHFEVLNALVAPNTPARLKLEYTIQ